MGYDGPNYTQTPNLFLDEHLPEMGCAETKVVLAVIRQTFGWHKRKDRLSISQLMEITGLSNRAVIDGTRAAMDRGVIAREEAGNSYQYWLVVDGENTSQEGVNNAHRGCEDTSQQGVNDAHTQKKQKQTNTKENSPAREDDTVGVEIWVDVTGERPTIGTRQELKQYFEHEAPRWDPEAFRSVLREAFVNVDRDAHRIQLGYLESAYEKELEHDTNMAVTEDGKLKGSPEPGAEYNARGYRIN